MPDVLTMAEAGIAGCEADVWFGVVGPRGLPSGIQPLVAGDHAYRAGQGDAGQAGAGRGRAADRDAGAVLGAAPPRYRQVGEAGAGVGGEY
ncbi:tripartite tricarboxylate transporter substrate-binding protein [Cupriavidus sp. MP-37]|uniref:tripartite tricarboxylate transporter substrate-binding protein n=1 Tax=Cupriavidus sp. MP-37 TaxID=2884455 RepID=UPI00210216E3|nr:tripartite tricarboxylate transporter substrate-binding protein [Cupriavidus sp. MP-37]